MNLLTFGMAILSDNQVHDLLFAAREVLGEFKGETVVGNNALVTARRALETMGNVVLVSSTKTEELTSPPDV
jgi:hypothetical protein